LPLYTTVPPAEGRRKLRKWRFAVLRAVGLLAFTLLGCMLGLFLLDTGTDPLGAKLFRALWNASNTISTLGDLDSLNHRQQVFMVGAMFTLVTVGGYAISTLTGVISGDDVQAFGEYRRVEKKLAELAGHYVVAGFGVIGRRVANRLRQDGRTVVVVEFDEAEAKRASDLGFLTVLMVAGRDEALEKVRLDTAAALLVTILNPDRKLALTLIARGMNPRLPIVVADDSDAEVSWLPHAGASRVILVDDLVAQALVDELAKIPATP
jgi:voltage-gated potassium channel